MFELQKRKPSQGVTGHLHEQKKSASAEKEHPKQNPVWQSLALRTPLVQPKLSVSQPNDPYEREADRVADHVMRIPAPSINSVPTLTSVASGQAQRKCSQCDEEERKLQRKEKGASADAVAHAPSSVNETLSSPGRPLDPVSRTFFEPRFGRDFSDVRVHTDARAAASARNVSALAYTVGRNIVFAAGQYAPSASGGRRLLAHELSHVVQQADGLLQRTPDPSALAEFDTRAAELKKHKVYLALGFTSKKQVGEIITEARKRDNALYFIEKLELLFNTPEKSQKEQAEAFSQETSEAAATEATRLSSKTNQARAGAEEAVSKDPTRVWTKAKGQDGTTFLIDARDVTNIAIQAKVRLVKAGPRTKAEDVTRVKSLQDAIEKRSSTMGYSLDLEFVETSGPDVFTVQVDTSKWTVSTNWIGDDIGLAHELHHLLGLEEDRYNYIEAHAENPQMTIPDRIHWFRQEFNKVIENNPLSMMSSGHYVPLDDDVCMVAGFRNKADIDACVEKRKEARIGKFGPALGKAAKGAFKAHEILSGILPASPHDKAGEPTMNQLKQQQATSLALHIFGKPVSLEYATDVVGATRYELMMWNLLLVAELTPGCDANPALSQKVTPRILLCPSFFDLGVEQQSEALLREAVHRAGVGTTTTDSLCPAAGCGQVCVDDNNAHAWVRFVKCIESM